MQDDKMQYVSGFSIVGEKTPTDGEESSETSNGCWNCRHFLHEDADGYGICQAFDAVEHCGNDPCNLWKERVAITKEITEEITES